jgi:S-(hydroxymethyl)glutathione dehydrogenase/alcohol dehydrogenase
MVGGHEGAGAIEAVGPGVTRVKPGDKAVCSFIPNCGSCRWCATGQQAICDWGAAGQGGPGRRPLHRAPVIMCG